MMGAVLEYAKVSFTIQSYAKAQSYTQASGTPFDPKYTKRAQRHAAAAATSSTSE